MAKEIRFAIGTPEDLRSSIWRLWANRDDLYLAARSISGLTKVSFHKSGINRFAVVSSTPRPALKRWARPPETEQGITPIFDVVVPAFTASQNPFRDRIPPNEKPTLFLKAPSIGNKIIVRILLAKPDLKEERLRRGAGTKPVNFHGAVNLRNETAWLVSYYDEFNPVERRFVANLITTTKINLKPESRVSDITHAMLHDLEMTTPPMIVDLQLSPENVYVEQ
ncbi:MAG: hypothetical protein HY242_03100 [Afipia sp.]|nr:hypothetical protein [Afipia sp.]